MAPPVRTPHQRARDALAVIARAISDWNHYPARTVGRAQADRDIVRGIETLVDAKIVEALEKYPPMRIGPEPAKEPAKEEPSK